MDGNVRGPGGLPPISRRQQVVWTGVCILALGITVAGALLQVASVPRAKAPGLRDWLLLPLEQNPALRQWNRKEACLTSVFFLPDGKNGWAVGQWGTILHTEDGGSNWDWQGTGKGNLWSVQFIDPKLGWAVGDDGSLHTEDGGRKWQVQSLNGNDSFRSVSFVGPQSGWALAADASIFHTEDGGKSWQAQLKVEKKEAVSAINAGLPFLLLAKSRSLSYLFPDSGSVVFVTPQCGWVISPLGKILQTKDGGKHWKSQLEVPFLYNQALAVVPPESAWVVGWRGAIFHTTNAGQSWKPQPSGTVAHLGSVAFPTPQSGWAVGTEGTILHTEDGGQNWQTQASGTTLDLTAVAFVTPQSGWIVGDQKLILHTRDGGRNWFKQQYHRWPAPWSYFVTLVCAVGLIVISRASVQTVQPTIFRMATSKIE